MLILFLTMVSLVNMWTFFLLVASLFFCSHGQDIKLPPAYAVGLEIIIPEAKNIHYRKTLGDRDRSIFSLDMSLPKTVDDELNIVEKSEIDVVDVKYNVLHIENKTTTECTVWHADSELFKFFFEVWEVILKDLYNLENGSHEFKGTVKIRGKSVDADLFQRIDNRPNPLTGLNNTNRFEWYILNQAWTEVGSGENTQGHRRPMMYKMSINDKVTLPFNLTMNFYDWAFRKPYLSEYSISNCYGIKFRKFVQVNFAVNGGSLSRKITIPEVDMIADKIAEVLGISVLRISKNSIKQTTSSVTFATSLLASAYEIKQRGSDVQQGKSLIDAFNELVDKSKKGMIQVSVGGVNLRSTGASEVGSPSANKGMTYGAGAMAGIAFGMLILGIVLAFVIIGVVAYKKTGKSPLAPFSRG